MGIALLCIIIIGASVIGGIYLFYNKIHTIKGKDYNYLFGKISNYIVDNAQYIPDANKIFSLFDLENDIPEPQNAFGNSLDGLSNDSEEAINMDFSEEGFSALCDQIGGLGDYACGKYLGYNIYELKDEMMFLTENTPIFNQWFIMDYDVGIVNPDMEYTSGWRYHIDYNDETERLSITRFSSKTRASVYLHEEDVIREENMDFSFDEYGNPQTIKKLSKPKTYQFQVMQMDYYYENGNEVVECNVYEVLRFGNEYYPIRYEYLKNTKDKSVTRYQIIVRDRLQTQEFMGNASTAKYHMPNGEGPYSQSGFDIDTNKPNGVIRNFIQIDYTDKNDIRILKIDQSEGNDFIRIPDITGILLYQKTPSDTIYYNAIHTYCDKENSKAKDASLYCNYEFENRQSSYDNSIENYFFEIFDRFEPLGRFIDRSISERHGSGCQSIKTIYTCDHFASSSSVTQKIKESHIISSNKNIENEIPYYINRGVASLAECLGAKNSTIDMIQSLPNTFYYDGNDYSYEGSIDNIFIALTVDALEKYPLRDEYKKLEKESSKGKSLKIDKEKSLDIFSEYIIEADGTYITNTEGDIQNGILDYYLYTSLNLSNIMEKGGEYSIVILAYSSNKDYIQIIEKEHSDIYDGSDKINLKLMDLQCNIKNVEINRTGRYKLGLAITATVAGEEKVVSEILPIDIFRNDIFTSPNQDVDGFIITKTYSLVSSEFYIIIKKKDVEAPVIEAVDAPILLSQDATYEDVFRKITITDNDKIEPPNFIAEDGSVFTFSDTVIAGEHTVVAVDYNGNQTTMQIEIELQ